MRLDLAERLRCPRAHVATPLVVVTTAVAERDLRRGFVGCPVCQLEARIADGVVTFAEAEDLPLADDGWGPTLDRLVALLGLAEPGGSVLLTGRYAACAADLARATDVAVVVMGAAAGIGADEHVGVVRGLRAAVPFSDATFRAVALDLPTDTAVSADVAAFAADAVRSVAVGGRVLARSATAVPDGIKELARDETEWVGERQLVSAPVELRRRQSSPS